MNPTWFRFCSKKCKTEDYESKMKVTSPKVIDLYESGLSVTEVAGKMGLSYPVVAKIIQDTGKMRSISDASKARWKMASAEYRLEHANRARASRLRQVLPVKDTSIEVLIQEGLAREGIPFVTHPTIHISQPDVVLLDTKVAIYADGCYWHGCPTHFPDSQRREKERDAYVNTYLRNRGWLVLRFWEHEIRADLSAVIKKIAEAMNQSSVQVMETIVV